MEYISYLDIPHHWGLKEGDVVLLSSDILQLTLTSLRNGESFDRNAFLDAILETIGSEGTLLIPTFNWDFCHGVPFDYDKTPCKTGSLGTIALKHPAFKRTSHPLYSFAVAGKDKEKLCSFNNTTSFGSDSPFGYLEENHAKNVIIGIHYSQCFTYVHHVEEINGVNTYRFQKTFTGKYIDALGQESVRSYSMLVRNLETYEKTDFTLLGELMEQEGAAKLIYLNDIPFRIVDLHACTRIIADDILHNRSRSICTYKGQ